MKRLLFSATLLAFAAVFTAQAEVSITVGQPGFYGRIDIGGYPQPQIIYPQPIIIEPVQILPAPIYLRVPPGHAKDWPKHCHKYNACREPVYFVQDNWYEQQYVPRYQKLHGDQRENQDRHENYEKRREHDGYDKHEKREHHRKHDYHNKRQGKRVKHQGSNKHEFKQHSGKNKGNKHGGRQDHGRKH
jgi:hypothetical protein